MKDYKGQNLCVSCWNGNHLVPEVACSYCPEHKADVMLDNKGCKKCRWKETGRKIVNCKGGSCECLCRELASEKAVPRKKKDKSLQTSISMDNPLVIGNQHDDRG